MAKGIDIMGTLRGNRGEITYQRTRGAQVSKTRQRRNTSKTVLQMTQRTKYPPIINFYNYCKLNLYGYAFFNKKQNQSPYNAFISSNVRDNYFWLTKQQNRLRQCPIAPFQISTGILEPVPFSVEFEATSGPDVSIVSGAYKKSDTWGKVSADLLLEHPFLRNLDQLTFILFVARDQYVPDDAPILANNIENRVAEVVININSTVTVETYLKDKGFSMPTGTTTQDYIIFDPYFSATSTDTWSWGGCVVVSRSTKRGAVCSNARLELNDNAYLVHQYYRTTAALNACLESYGMTSAVMNPNQTDTNQGTGIEPGTDIHPTDPLSDKIFYVKILHKMGTTTLAEFNFTEIAPSSILVQPLPYADKHATNMKSEGFKWDVDGPAGQTILEIQSGGEGTVTFTYVANE